eukprot:TRINITY_DN48089_c0_g1_i1.p1 TRINITY_DN48089_c0_g1~~TRINITY_DN48089_c0_g1_i1.p1  ORF type:complete len:369 (+),score=108.51 TRINITY_DN48089_c0_g1_i1:77-1183(+)
MGPLTVLAPLRAATGNHTTVERLNGYFSALGYDTTVVDCHSDSAGAAVGAALRCGAPLCLLHAWRSGVAFLPALAAAEATAGRQLRAPLLLVFGGTDVNEMAHDAERLTVMSRVADLCTACVAFSESMRAAALRVWPQLGPRIRVVPQAVSVAPTPPHAPDGTALLRQWIAAAGGPAPGPDPLRVLVAPMGLRTVKDPMFAVRGFAAVHRQLPAAWLLVVGPALDPELERELGAACCPGSGALYHREVPQGFLHAALGSPQAVGVLNCSRSEGQPQAALEGVLCGAAPLLRRIPGNSDCFAADSALFFSDEAEFTRCCCRLLGDLEFAAALAARARAHARDRFCPDRERAGYAEALEELARPCVCADP